MARSGAARRSAQQQQQQRGGGSDGEDARSMEAVSGFTSPGGPVYDYDLVRAHGPTAFADVRFSSLVHKVHHECK